MVENGRGSELEGGGTGFGNGVILIARSAAYSNGSHDLSAFTQRNSARENHDPAIVGSVDSEELPSRLGMRSKVFGCDIKGPGRVRLFYGYVNAANPRSIHAHMRNEVSPFIRYRDVHWLADLDGLLLGCGNNSFCIV